MLQKFAGPLVGAPFCGAPVRPNMLNMPKSASAHVCCGQTAGSIKMPLGRDVDLGPGRPGHTALDGDPAPPERGTAATLLFDPCLLWQNGRPVQLLLSSCYKKLMPMYRI